MGIFDSIKEWTPEKNEKAEPTTEQKVVMNEVLAALGYGPHYPIEAPPPAATPPTPKTDAASTETPEANDAEAAERASIREELARLQSAVDLEKRRIAREAPPVRSEREPETKKAQSKADLLAALRPILAGEVAKQRADKDARRALRRLGGR